jgi:hypothetical protein
MLTDTIKLRLKAAMKARNAVEKEILRVALGEIQTMEARSSEVLSEEQAVGIVRKLVKSNEETKANASDADRVILEEEIEILQSLLPRSLSVDEIAEALSSIGEQLKGAKADGPAVGMAMKELKARGANVEGKDVTAAVRRIRG